MLGLADVGPNEVWLVAGGGGGGLVFSASQQQQQQHLLLLLNWHTAHSAGAGSNVLCLSHELLAPLKQKEKKYFSCTPSAVSAVAKSAPTGNGWSRLAAAAAAHRYFATFAMVIFMFTLAPTHTQHTQLAHNTSL